MILAVDVHYQNSGAVAAGVLFEHWTDAEVTRELCVSIPRVATYEPGHFYKRELPCILAFLNKLKQLPDFLILDGHVYLDKFDSPGLGKHVYDALHGEVAVIGVAKSRFKDTPSDTALFRCGSKRPLYVTAVGLDNADAKGFIMQMHGQFRLPTILRRVDQLSRGTA